MNTPARHASPFGGIWWYVEPRHCVHSWSEFCFKEPLKLQGINYLLTTTRDENNRNLHQSFQAKTCHHQEDVLLTHSHLSTMPTRCDDGAQPYKFDAKLVILLQQKGRYSIDQLKRRRKVLAESELYLEVNFFLFLTIKTCFFFELNFVVKTCFPTKYRCPRTACWFQKKWYCPEHVLLLWGWNDPPILRGNPTCYSWIFQFAVADSRNKGMVQCIPAGRRNSRSSVRVGSVRTFLP